MPQSDLGNGRLVCLIGVAPLRPAKFVIFRIGQWWPTGKSWKSSFRNTTSGNAKDSRVMKVPGTN